MAVSDTGALHTASAPSIWQMVSEDGTPRRALLTALIVGTTLIAINHGDLILIGQWPPAVKVFLTYCTPYIVTTWGAVTGKRAQWMREQRVTK